MSEERDLDRLITLATERTARAAASTTRWVFGIATLLVLLLFIALNQRRSLATHEAEAEAVRDQVVAVAEESHEMRSRLERVRLGERYAREGVELAGRGRLSDAIAAYTTALGHDPDHAGHYELRGYAYLRRYQIDGRTNAADLERAILDLERAAAVDSTYEWGHYNLALAYWEDGREADALDTLDFLFRLNPRFRGVVQGDPQYRRILADPRFAELAT